MYMNPRPQPKWNKKSIVLMGLVLVGSMLLAGSATFSMYTEKRTPLTQECNGTISGKIVFAKNNDAIPFEVIDENGNRFIPVLQSNESVLSKTGHASICYSLIENNNKGVGRIYVNKVDYLPLPNEGK